MNKVDELENTLTELFRSGADEDHDETEMEELLEGMDYPTLLQGLHVSRMPVYEFRADSKLENSFEYRGQELFSGTAMLLYTDIGDACLDVALHSRFYELWLLEDMTLAVVSVFRNDIGNGTYVTEYRSYKGEDWEEAGMCIDFLDLADDLDSLCASVYEREVPYYEL